MLLLSDVAEVSVTFSRLKVESFETGKQTCQCWKQLLAQAQR